MNLTDLLSFTFSAQAECNDCFGSTFSSVSAAWATKGYWAQADIIHYLGATGLGVYASLLYIIAVGAGLVGYMLGNPPRNYLWYLFGPALFNILLFTTVPSGGVNWQLGLLTDGSPDLGDQREVWRLAEVGLLNQNIRSREGMSVFSDKAPTGGTHGGKVEVAHAFVWVDEIVSDFIQGLIGLLGANFLDNNSGAGGSTNINEVSGYASVPTSQFAKMSDLKWSLLQNITAASVKSPAMAKTLGIFMGSECGDILISEIDQESFTRAARARTGLLPSSVFINRFMGPAAPGTTTQTYEVLQQRMDGMWISTPHSLQDIYKVSASGTNGLNDFSPLTTKATAYLNDPKKDSISCTSFLSYIVEAMRWESGNAAYQLIEQAPDLIPPPHVLFALYYGWGVRDLSGTRLTAEQLQLFTVDLILVHIVKNLFEYTPVAPDQRYTPSQEAVSYIELQQKTISSTTKFAEVYSWALMIPYIQGLVLYFLCIAYPVVCVAMIMPGMHKLPITWIKYWFWAKSWDLGFALVKAVERSVWAMLSNTEHTQKTLGYVVEMKQWSNGLHFECMNQVASSVTGRGCGTVRITDTLNGAADAFKNYIMPVFDRALMLSVNLELDLANSYYIYIMAALYFAVPAVAGQLVGAAGNIASGALDKMTDVKGAASTGFTSEANQRMMGFGHSMGQAASLKGQQNLGIQGLKAGNLQNKLGAEASGLEAMNSMLNSGSQMAGMQQSKNSAQMQAAEGIYGRVKESGKTMAAMGGLKGAAAAVGGFGALFAANAVGDMMGAGDAPDANGAPNGPAGARPAAGAKPGQRAAAPAGGAFKDGINEGLKMGAIAGDFAAGVSMEAAKAHNAVQTAKTQAGYQGQMIDNSARGAAVRFAQTQAGAEGQRIGAAQQFSGAETRWNAMNDLNTKTGGKLGVIGLNFSPFGPGPRSDNFEGAAYQGAVGSGSNFGDSGKRGEAHKAATFYSPGQEFSQYTGGMSHQISSAGFDAKSNFNPNTSVFQAVSGNAAGGFQSFADQGVPGAQFAGDKWKSAAGGANPTPAANVGRTIPAAAPQQPTK